MNNNFNADEFSAKIQTLMEDGCHQDAIDICSETLSGCDDVYNRIAVLLLRSACHMAAGHPDCAVKDHSEAFELGDDLPSVEQLGIAEDALKSRLPFDYCAQTFIRSGERFIEEGDDTALAAGAFNKAGICLFRNSSSTEEEKACFHRALAIMADDSTEDDSDDRVQVLTALIQSNLAECLSREGESAQAIEMYNSASKVFEQHLGDEDRMCLTHYAICQRCLSDLYRHSEENIQAHTCLSRSIAELERRRDQLPDQLRLHLAVCYNARGTLRFQMGDYEGEVDDCTRSMQLREDLESDPVALATVISNRAEAYSMLGRFEPAKADFLRAVELLDTVQDSDSAAITAATRCYSLGLLYNEEHFFPEAADAFRSAAERIASVRSRDPEDIEYTREQLIDIEALARMRLGAAIYQCTDRDYFDAMTEGREAIRLLEQLPLTVDRAARLAALHLSMGEILEMFDEMEAAETEYDLAEDYRQEGISLAMSEPAFNDGEEYEYEEFQDESSIWEDFSDDAPQG